MGLSLSWMVCGWYHVYPVMAPKGCQAEDNVNADMVSAMWFGRMVCNWSLISCDHLTMVAHWQSVLVVIASYTWLRLHQGPAILPNYLPLPVCLKPIDHTTCLSYKLVTKIDMQDFHRICFLELLLVNLHIEEHIESERKLFLWNLALAWTHNLLAYIT